MERGIVLFILILILTILNGCGGGSNNDVLGLLGDQGDSGGSSISPIDSAYSLVREGSYDRASTIFNEIISDASTSNDEKALAYSGLGWIDLKRNGSSNVSPDNQYFRNALMLDPNNDEANMGLAIIYLAYPGTQEVAILEGLGLSDINAGFNSDYIDITSAEAHALMALAYFSSGEDDKALMHIERARELDGSDITIMQVANGLDTLINH